MKVTGLRSHHYLAVLTLLLAPTITYAMSGMDMPHSGHGNGTSSFSKSLGEPINSSEAEMEITYSADGKTAIFVSGRQGSIPSPEVPYNFDIWMAHNVNGEWQEPLNLGDTINTTGEDMCWTFTPDGKTFTGGSGPRDSYNHDILWVSKEDVPLLKNFELIGPPPNLLTSGKRISSDTK